MSEEAVEEPTLDTLVGRIHEIAGEGIEAYADLAKRAVAAFEGDADERKSWYRDACMAWAGSAGRWVEAAYLSAVVADRIGRPSRDRG
ncbi:MAG: hypothetical protein ACYDH6_21135 [Acidimicrobiales bacterium]